MPSTPLAPPAPPGSPGTLLPSLTDQNSELLVALQYFSHPFGDRVHTGNNLTWVDNRFAPILEAIAVLAVSEPFHEVLAVALQIDLPHHSITLTIASNATVPPKTIAHLEGIWASLRIISDAYHRRRSSSSNLPRELPYMTFAEGTDSPIMVVRRRRGC